MTLIIQKPTGAKLNLAQTYVGIDDPDAAVYVAAVEAADEAESPGVGALETATRVAIHSFVKGCKADGIWPAIKASCILAGARTLAGALTPLAGTAPTNFNFVSGDYNRKTGLVGDGTSKYLNSNRLDSADPINSFHCSTYLTTAEPTGNAAMYMGLSGRLQHVSIGTSAFYASKNSGFSTATNSGKPVNFFGQQRSSLTSETARVNGNTYTANKTATANNSNPIFVFRFSQNSTPYYPSARLAFYSIGESLNLALLDARVTTLINTFAAAIP
jgi:hypothetical protein